MRPPLGALVGAALDYARRGWPVVALHHPIATGDKPICSCEKCGACPHIGKHPRYDRRTLGSGPYSATTNPDLIREWWRTWPEANVGIAVGPRAGLLVVDIDPRNGGEDTFASLVAELGPLPHTIETLTGGGGRHLLFSHPGGRVRGDIGHGVDIVGSDGMLIVAEPSLHKSGKRYSWELSSTPDLVELARLPSAWESRILFQGVDGEDGETGLQGQRGQQGQQGSIPTAVDPAVPVIPDSAWDADRAIRETVPTGRGQHDKANMMFARVVKLHLGFSTAESARSLFDRWFDLARPHIDEQDYDVAWMKFCRAFELARIPVGVSDLAARAYDAASRTPFPNCAQQFRSDRTKRLVGLCCQLSRAVGNPFKLSCHQVAKLFGCKPAKAWELLQGLAAAGILRNEDRGRAGMPGHGAATWTYLGD